jgi:hypothetical protein
LVESSTVTRLGRVPGDRGGIRTAGIAVSSSGDTFFATAAHASSVLSYSAAGLEEEQLAVIDDEGLAFAATLRNLGPVLVSRPVGDVYLRTPGGDWAPSIRLHARMRRASDFGTGAVFFDTDGELLYYSSKAGVCPMLRGPWTGSAQGAPVGPHLLVNATEDDDGHSSWMVRVREPK